MISCYRYRIPFKHPFKTGRTEYNHRTGFFLKLHKDGITSLGEAAPLPGFSKETAEEVHNQIHKHGYRLNDYFNGEIDTEMIEESDSTVHWLPSLRFAVDSLIVDYLAKKNKQTPRAILFDNPEDRLAVNATLPVREPDQNLDYVRNKWDEGYRTFKIKAGRNFTEEYRTLEKLYEAYPDAKLRIDANRSWDLGEAVNHLNSLESFEPEYCEEPLSDPTPESLEILGRETSIPVALDESLYQSPGIIKSGYKTDHPRFIIIKPMVLGGFSKIFETIRVAASHEYTPVFTTSLESGVGRIMTATLASGLGTEHLAHGLATGSLLKMDIWHDRTYINNGYFYLPDYNGMGEKYSSQLENLTLEPIELNH